MFELLRRKVTPELVDDVEKREAYVDAVLWTISERGVELSEEIVSAVQDQDSTVRDRYKLLEGMHGNLSMREVEILLGADMFPFKFAGERIRMDDGKKLLVPHGNLYEMRLRSGEVDELIERHQAAMSSADSFEFALQEVV